MTITITITSGIVLTISLYIVSFCVQRFHDERASDRHWFIFATGVLFSVAGILAALAFLFNFFSLGVINISTSFPIEFMGALMSIFVAMLVILALSK